MNGSRSLIRFTRSTPEVDNLAWEARIAGALQRSVRGNQVFAAGLADPNLWSNRVDVVDVGLNWYLNKFVKVYFDWEHAMFGQAVYASPGVWQKTNDLFWLRLAIYL